MPTAGPSNVSSASLLELRALTAEHVDRFEKEGRAPVKGAIRQSVKPKDPFARSNPGLVKRLAAEARNDARSRQFQDQGEMSDEQRRAILKAKAKKYDAMRRGDLSGLSAKELEEAVIDFERKWEDEGFSEHPSDEDESANPAGGQHEDDLQEVEYVDEMGRTRRGTRKEAREADRAKRRDGLPVPETDQAEGSAYAEVMQSKVIHGDQNFFPVYEPDADVIKAKYRQAEEDSRQHHYDATKEVRTRGAGQYQFSQDEEQRAEQLAALTAERQATERARSDTTKRGGMSKAQEAHKRKLDERRALIDSKRAKVLGGVENVDRLRREKKEREAESFLKSLEDEFASNE